MFFARSDWLLNQWISRTIHWFTPGGVGHGGITGLLPLLQDITRDVHVRSFSGKVAAIDAYFRLHKAAIFCAEETILENETMRYVSTLRSYTCLKCLILNASFSLVLFSPQIFFLRYIDMCVKYIHLLVENNVQPILVFDGMEMEAKANVESFRRRSQDNSKLAEGF